MWVAHGYDMLAYKDEINKHLDYRSSTLIIAPRQCGKTNTLFDRFISTEDNVALFAFGGSEVLRYRERCKHVRRTDKVSRVFVNTDSIRGRWYDTIYIDEPFLAPDLQRTLDTIKSACRRVVAIGTPTGAYRTAIFPNVIKVNDILDGNIATSIFSDRKEHFNNMEDLFRI